MLQVAILGKLDEAMPSDRHAGLRRSRDEAARCEASSAPQAMRSRAIAVMGWRSLISQNRCRVRPRA
jgi:hypothetical protein